MIGLVLVSHSAALAQGAAELAAQMGGRELRIAVAGGLDLPDRPLGTDAGLVAQAVDDVWSEDGVLVLMDLGSAVLSAEMALDLLPPERRARVLLSAAPLVEGAVAAAVAAGLGEDLEHVAAEAAAGLAAKVAHLTPAELAPATPAATPAPAASRAGLTLRVTVANRLGLHARPAALFVRTVGRFDANVMVTDVSTSLGPANARSLSALATLGVEQGHEILVEARGAQAQETLAAVRALADDNFGDPRDPGSATATSRLPNVAAAPEPSLMPQSDRPASALPRRPAAGSVLRGLPAAPGIVIGRAWQREPGTALVADAADTKTGAVNDVRREDDEPAADPEAEWLRLQDALAATSEDVRRAHDSIAGRAGQFAAAIFDAHLLLLADEALLAPAREQIIQHGKSAAVAWADAVAAVAEAWAKLDDPYQRARAADLHDLGQQVLRHLHRRGDHQDQGSGEPTAPAILLLPDVTPAEMATFDPARVAAVACAAGGPTSHAAVLARALGIPTVMALGPAVLAILPGTTLALDGDEGTLVVDPSPEAQRAARERRAERRRKAADASSRAHLPAVTRHGRAVHVAANVSKPADVSVAVAAGADGVGLLRTEFLFLGADRLPNEDEQEIVYRTIAEELAGRPLTVRTLDVGGDKQLPGLMLAGEQNPALGLRGARLGLSRPELLLSQFRAVLRVAHDHPVRVMLPMVTTLDEIRRARELLEEARDSLATSGMAAAEHVELGIMVEVPAAALMAQRIAPQVDFLSIGTNDLAQYVFAADRGNADVAPLADALHPAVLILIDRVCAAAAGRPVAVCGELAGDPRAVPLLLGLGITELSLSPARIPLVKQAVRETDTGPARRLARQALAAQSADEVRRLLQRASS